MSNRLRVKKGAGKLRGLGDLVAIVADPIAKVLKLDPEKCGCKGTGGRQERWNKAVPFG
jgi:hypothetical protein